MTAPDAPTAMTLEEALRDALGDMIHEFGAGAGWRTEKQEAALKKALRVFLARQEGLPDPTAELADLRAQVQQQRAAVREFLDAWLDKTDHPSGESSSYSVDAAERLERAVAELKRIAEADDA